MEKGSHKLKIGDQFMEAGTWIAIRGDWDVESGAWKLENGNLCVERGVKDAVVGYMFVFLLLVSPMLTAMFRANGTVAEKGRKAVTEAGRVWWILNFWSRVSVGILFGFRRLMMAGAQALTLFVGQIPFRSSKDQVGKHFSGDGFKAAVKSVRMLTEKETGEFRGMAFVEFNNNEDYEKALKMDYSVMNGRRIRVERTVGGGGKKRTQKLKEVIGTDVQKRKEEVDALVDGYFSNAHTKLLTKDDFDEQIRDFLVTIPIDVAKESMEEMSRLKLDKVRNRRRYIMGVLKRKMKDLGQSEKQPGREKRRSERDNGHGNEAVDTTTAKSLNDKSETHLTTLAKNYDDGGWYEAAVVKELEEDKVVVRFVKTGKEQQTMREDIKQKSRRKRKAKQPTEREQTARKRRRR